MAVSSERCSVFFHQTATMEETQLKLYSYWRSSCSCRVRIALNLKRLKYEYKAVNLVKGEQFSPEFSKLNPLNFVPALVDGDIVVADSFAILMYLEEKYPQHPLLPQDLHKRAINYQAANIVSANIQPLQNLVVLKYIEEKCGSGERLTWVKHHIEKGFAALEKLLKDHAGKYATGDEVFLDLASGMMIGNAKESKGLYWFRAAGKQDSQAHHADLFLAPQIHAALKRFKMDMTEFPLLLRLNEAYNELPAFQDAMPEKQPDYVPS